MPKSPLNPNLKKRCRRRVTSAAVGSPRIFLILTRSRVQNGNAFRSYVNNPRITSIFRRSQNTCVTAIICGSKNLEFPKFYFSTHLMGLVTNLRLYVQHRDISIGKVSAEGTGSYIRKALIRLSKNFEFFKFSYNTHLTG